MSRALATQFDPVSIRDNAARAASYSSEHKCMWVHLMRAEDRRDLLSDLAILAEVECRFTKTEPAYSTKAGDHIKLRTTEGWYHVHGRNDGPDYNSLVGMLSSLCNGYWVIY